MQLENRHFDIVNIIRRWLWLLILTTLLASLVAFWITKQQPTIFEASSRLVVGPGIDSPSPDLNSLKTGGQLMQTYAQLAMTRPVLVNIIDDLGLSLTPIEVMERLRITSNTETQILTISVQDTDQARAIAVANEIAEILVRMSPSGAESPAVRLNLQMQNTVDKLGEEIIGIERSIATLEGRYAIATEAEDRRLMLDELTKERARLTETNRTLVTLFETLSTASTNQVKIIETAAFSYEVESQARLKVLIGFIAGLVLSVVIVLAFEYFDETIKSVEELGHATRVPVLGAIAGHRPLRGSGRNRLVVQALPESRVAERYRMLGTKLLFSNGRKTGDSRSILLSSGGARDKEDTGEAAANLAVILAQAGKRVVLVDANLQRSTMTTIAELFDIEDRLGGLTDVLTGQAKAPRLTPVSWAPGLSILPTGPVSYDSFALLSSTRMVELLTDLQRRADIIIITAPPLLSYADSLILASRVDGAAIVVRRGKTRPVMINEVVETLRSLDARVIGTILDEKRSLRMPGLPWFRKSRVSPPIPSRDDFELEEGSLPTTQAKLAGRDKARPVMINEVVERLRSLDTDRISTFLDETRSIRLLNLPWSRKAVAAEAESSQADPEIELAEDEGGQPTESELAEVMEAVGPVEPNGEGASAPSPAISDSAASLPDEVVTAELERSMPAKHKLEHIHGIGSVYAGRLRDKGVVSIADLAEELPARLADIVGLPMGQADSKTIAWIEEAKTLLAESEDVPDSP